MLPKSEMMVYFHSMETRETELSFQFSLVYFCNKDCCLLSKKEWSWLMQVKYIIGIQKAKRERYRSSWRDAYFYALGFP